jgi:acetyltransferase-like isoleucine patch superfamily enzyme
MKRQALDTPWKIRNELGRWLAYPWVRLLFAVNGIPWRRGWHFYGVPIIQKHRRSQITFGAGLQLRSSLRSNPLGSNHPVILATWRAGACLDVGSDFAMTGGVLCSAERITIGNNVGVGANTTIIDTDFHSYNPVERLLSPLVAKTAPVTVEDGAFIGMNCLILKGVTIGQDSIVGAGSVVSRDVPPHVLVAGNPAQVIRVLPHDEDHRYPLQFETQISERQIKSGENIGG